MLILITKLLMTLSLVSLVGGIICAAISNETPWRTIAEKFDAIAKLMGLVFGFSVVGLVGCVIAALWMYA